MVKLPIDDFSNKKVTSKVRIATVEVDEVDQLADQYNIAMMSTFIAFRKHVVFQRISGSNWRPMCSNFFLAFG